MEIAVGRINASRRGLVFAALIGGWHLLWSVLVAVGVAQAVIDFVLWMHFLKPVFVLETFSLTKALLLVLVTATIGYAAGWMFAVLWNAAGRSAKPNA